MASYSRRLSAFGSEIDRDRAALETERNELRARVAHLERDLREKTRLNAVLLKSQATRNQALKHARKREEALKQELAACGVPTDEPESPRGEVTYLGQKRQAGSLLGP
jgi:septal ring factor EnvC (AmiA/AmiB activator)